MYHRSRQICHRHDSALQWRHNERDGVSNHQPRDCLLNRLLRYRSKKTSKLCVTGFCEGNSLVTGEFPVQRASNTEHVSIWWRHHRRGISVVSHRHQILIKTNVDFPWIRCHKTTFATENLKNVFIWENAHAFTYCRFAIRFVHMTIFKNPDL